MDARERIMTAAAELIADTPGEPVSTRAICSRADVGPPTLYHHFGDKDGLFEAVVAKRFEDYLAAARAQHTGGDPVADLRAGWDFHLGFGRDNPAFYVLMYAQPVAGRPRTAAAEAHADLVTLLQDVAGAGLLRGAVELAADTIEAALVGATLQVINHADTEAALAAAEAVRTAVFGALLDADTAPAAESGLAPVARQLAALLAREQHGLTPGEVGLFGEWVARLS